MREYVKRFDELTLRELYAILKLRTDIFVVEQHCPYPEADGRDQEAVHVFLEDGEGIQAYLRVMDRGVESEYVSIGRVLAVKRRQGLGSRVLAAGIRAARDCFGAEAVYLEAQTYAAGLYEKAGFRRVSGEFLLDGIPHVKMLLTLEGASCPREAAVTGIRYVLPEDRAFWFSLDRHLPPEEFDRKVRDRRGYVCLAEGRPVGLLRYNLFWDSVPFCTLLYIREGERRKGYGRALMEHWEAEMGALGRGLVLTSTQADEEAQHFYRRLGYRDCGSLTPTAPGYRQPPELILEKAL